jgi:hypothetical protein
LLGHRCSHVHHAARKACLLGPDSHSPRVMVLSSSRRLHWAERGSAMPDNRGNASMRAIEDARHCRSETQVRVKDVPSQHGRKELRSGSRGDLPSKLLLETSIPSWNYYSSRPVGHPIGYWATKDSAGRSEASMPDRCRCLSCLGRQTMHAP